MTERISRLRAESTGKRPSLTAERALLLTRFYNTPEARKMSVPVRRAKAFEYILMNKKLYVGEGELIVGERGPEPQACPTYPEICIHSEQDLEMLHNRPKLPFTSDDETRRLYHDEIIPFWEGSSIREKMFEQLPKEWHNAYRAGVFTEFMEQRPPGHTVLDNKIYRKGMKDFISDIDESLRRHSGSPAKVEELKAMRIAAQAIIGYARRYAELLEELAAKEKNAARKNELKQMAAICRKVPAKKPDTFWEALQYYWFVHVGVITEVNPWDSFNPGRLDQHLQPFYERETAAGSLTRDQARELLECFWIKFNNHPAPPKIGVTAKESNTYTDFALINLGGVKTDGSNAVNEMTWLLLDVIEEMRLLQPSSMVQVSKKTPDNYIRRFLKIVKTGYGQPSIFNTDALIQEMLRHGKSIEDARDGGASGCVETGAFGKEAYILTGYFNLPKVLEITLHNGFDPGTGKQIGLKTGEPESFGSFDEFYQAFDKQLQHFAGIKIHGNRIIEEIYAHEMPVPFLSILIDDCIANGTDYNAGGARYNTRYIQGVGLGSISDQLAAIRYHVFDHKTISFNGLMDALHKNFDGYEEFRDILINRTPKYGNDDDYADDMTRMVFESWYRAVDGQPGVYGSTHRINLLPTTSHVYFGSVTGAMPDGRKAGTPLSEGISPVQGADRNGPTAVIKSVAKIDHVRTGGTLLNQKFTPSFLEDDAGIEAVLHLIRTYFRLDGHHIQFNVVTADTLRKARKEPEKYRDLIVRVVGYSDYFVDLTEELQEEIIRRTEHQSA